VQAKAVIQVMGERVPILVRVESGDEWGVRKALDCGAAGIIVPQLCSKEACEHVVQLAKYPPLGRRGVGLGRAACFGNELSAYLSRANEETAVVVQIEHIDAVQKIDQIVSVAGIDAVFVGPFDLSASLGKPGATDDPVVQEAISTVVKAAKARGISAGIFANSTSVVQCYVQQGFSLIAVASDGLLLGRAAVSELQRMRAGT
jgi:2-keto-3-deoxy-L-rhamnonate aldolase RhmA